jgi:predicted enzyme related to lactoylglutathione lyase
MATRVVHFEIPTDDIARASAFYQAALDYVYEPWADDMGMITPPGDEGISGDLHVRSATVPHPTVVFTVDDLDETLAKVLANGGEQLGEIQPLTETSRWVYVRDSEGNAIGLHDNNPVVA